MSVVPVRFRVVDNTLTPGIRVPSMRLLVVRQSDNVSVAEEITDADGEATTTLETTTGPYVVSVQGATGEVFDDNNHIIAPSDPLLVAPTVAALATFTGTRSVSSILVTPGESITLNVNALGNQVVTFDATQARRTGVAGTWPTLFAGGETLTVRVNGAGSAPLQTVTFTVAAQAIEDVLRQINEQLVDAHAVDELGEVRLRSDRFGTSSNVDVVGGTGRATLGLAVGDTSGTGDVSDSEAVTFAEIKALIEADVSDTVAGDRLAASQDSGGNLVLTVTDTSNPAGPTSTFDLVAGDVALVTALGLTTMGTLDGGDAPVGTAALAIPQDNTNTFQFEGARRVPTFTQANPIGAGDLVTASLTVANIDGTAAEGVRVRLTNLYGPMMKGAVGVLGSGLTLTTDLNGQASTPLVEDSVIGVSVEGYPGSRTITVPTANFDLLTLLSGVEDGFDVQVAPTALIRETI